MTYDALEKSAYGGKPIELYKFISGSTIWRYADGDRDFTLGTETYKMGWALSRTEPELSEETTRSSLKITAPKDFPIARLFLPGAPNAAMWVSVFRVHAGDTDAILIWQGKVRGATWAASKGEATLECDPVEAVFGKGGLRLDFGPNCGKHLYSARCGVAEALHMVPFTLTAVSPSGFVLTAPEFASKPDQHFRMGELYLPDLGAHVLVVDHVGQNITVRFPVLGLAAGLSGRALPGCNHFWRSEANTAAVAAMVAAGSTLAQASTTILPDGDCSVKFNNRNAFGGWPFVPSKNPFAVTIEG